ncbi:MAG: YraN family protein [Candidatus Hatepunaea meridiana]|nr:YraN family protein [Candidatus Hatepunaea meridiana]
MNKSTPHKLGSDAELAAAAYLKQKGLRILEKNYRIRQGEIDIIAQDKDQLVFVEVKSSSNSNGWYPGERIDSRKRKHIQITASQYISEHEIPAGGIRFDAILMTTTVYKEWKIEHIVDAFRVE